MKKVNTGTKVIISVISIFILFGVIFTVSYFRTLFSAQQEIVGTTYEYKPCSIASDDGEYILHTKKIEDKTGAYATFSIERADEQKVVFECSEKYRIIDLKSIEWNSHDVIVKSSDVGTVTYCFADDNWTK